MAFSAFGFSVRFSSEIGLSQLLIVASICTVASTFTACLVMSIVGTFKVAVAVQRFDSNRHRPISLGHRDTNTMTDR